MAYIGTQYKHEQLIFLDELAKDERTITHGYGYSEVNTKAVKRVAFIHSKQYTILLALALDSIIAIDIMEGSCAKEKFKNFVISQVLPQMNSYPHTRSVLVIDNARIHHHDGLI
ncbi:20895_t:CDS:2 [Gigaspora margarita]|uniref:20895_t:CDS:1 n=1 Tax=Gigaspora margarita TaxID=4874 RepID=A0ABN7UUT4_GIGMA|nr:20895_t:CDS:2 [Gigaspora margarita]